MGQGREEQLEDGHLTYQVALQEDVGGEERQREKECVKDSQTDSLSQGRAAWALGPPAAAR